MTDGTIDGILVDEYPPALFPWLYPSLYPDYEPPGFQLESALPVEPTPEPDPVPDLVSDSTQSVEVVSVDDLLNLIQAINEPELSEEQPADEVSGDPGDTVAVELSPGDLAVIEAIKGIKTELIQISDQLADMQLSGDRPLLTTSFSDYTVTEGLLLLLLLSVFLSACYKLLRGGFQWLRS